MNDKNNISLEECRKQVPAMGYLFGLLYYHFAKTAIEQLGEKKGTDLVLKAVRSYGYDRGTNVRKRVEAKGLPLTVENFNRFNDLPWLGWRRANGAVVSCSYANPWIEKKVEDIGKLYCEVDIAKFKAYNPKITVRRLEWLLDHQPCCRYEFKLED